MRAREAQPDMILPTLVGTSILRMKKDPLTKPIPVVILSGISQRNEHKLKVDGAAAFLEKWALDLDGDGTALVAAVKALMEGENERAGSIQIGASQRA